MYMLHMILYYIYIFLFVVITSLITFLVASPSIARTNSRRGRTWNALREISGKMSDRPEVTQAAKS